MTPDAATRRWIANAADEKAAASGARFDEARGQFVVDWIERYCSLYQGDAAGQLMVLGDWQYDATMRAFGWVRLSAERRRWVRRFTRLILFTPKKQGKSPTLAAWSLHLTAGDGEQGQNVYVAARDRPQAMLSFNHAVEMVEASPELRAEFDIKRGGDQGPRLIHLPTKSVCRVVAGDNKKSQEGLNGCVMVDETHVVSRELMSILKGAGISRSEPMQIEVSTAGNNPDGYGKSRWDYGEMVNRGEIDDPHTLFIAYAAPQDLSDADLDADPLKYARMANPALGRLTTEEEFLASYHASKHSLSDLLDFKMYRLNIWQRSSNPWLRAGDWAACRRDFAEADLEGRECVAALDLSRTRDMSAVVLLFPEDDESFKLLPYFFLPEDYARSKAGLAPFLEFAHAGHLVLTPGGVVDYNVIKACIKDKSERFSIREITYDQTYAEEVTQYCQDELGIARVAYPQTIMEFACPTKEFERLVLAGKLNHNGHPVMAWQIGHAQVRADVNSNIRPVKPKPDDVRKIDGVVAAVMALGRILDGNRPQACTVEAW